jgi:diguanylate cyclase (GGDEF)-like protein
MRGRDLGFWRALCVGLTAAYAACAIVPRGGSGYSLAVDGVLYTAAYGACALCCATRAPIASGSTAIWRLFAAGFGMYTLGWAALSWYLTRSPEQPIPSFADLGWVGLYPLAFAAIVQLMRRLRADRSSVLTLLDAVVAGLGSAAVCAALVLPAVASSASGPETGWLVTLTDVAYPSGDLLLLGGVVAAVLVARFRVPAAVWVLLAAVVALLACDSTYVAGIATGTFAWDSWQRTGWLVAVLAVTLFSGARFDAQPAREGSSWLVHSVPGLAIMSSLVILLVRSHGRLEPVVAGLAAVTVAVAVARLMLSFHEARALAHSQWLAHTDELTGLVNRRGFHDIAARALAGATNPMAVLLVDLDGFKDINDGLGHPTGDELLRALGRRLQREAHNGAATIVVARIGGDEFAILADDADHRADVVARDVLAAIREPFYIQALDLRIDASIGIASSGDHGGGLDDLVRRADIAMYKAKARHLGALRYSAEAEQSATQLRLMAQLRYALEHDPEQLVLHYQPKVNLLSGRLAGVEALARWQHEERGLLMPAEFLPLVQKARLQRLLTERVLERVLAELPLWRGELRGQPVAVNLPAESVSDPTLVDCVANLLRQTETPAHRLQLEITEDFLMADLDGARVVLERLRSLGVAISIDDYGTGYSSLAYLRDLPVDELKLDRAFVSPIMRDERAAAIVRSTIELAHSLGLRMVAEGIEDTETWHRLLAMGCDVGQGYLFGYPQPGAALVDSLERLRSTA